MIPRRVVVTGLGVVSPLGTGVSHFWNNLLQGKCGVVNLKSLSPQQQQQQQETSVNGPQRGIVMGREGGGEGGGEGISSETAQRWDKDELAKISSLPSTVAAIVQSGSRAKGLFDPKEWLTAKVGATENESMEAGVGELSLFGLSMPKLLISNRNCRIFL
jgi:3-oxoacyl-(acyl-carrier-protein) synthase